ncbi:hypothetical protein CIW68_05285 [Enterobacter cloacae]|uniref:Uncharacterized protein n=1 Tax=Enterobacter cloacae TaxID=550 RepID=A0A3R9FTS6_ENTCL|nr:hypothetical protein CIW68_05285 [Enterobacter cloacae]PAO18633.1 hypothetical protein CIW57_07860 [Enterobacter cloacae]RHI05583.1 hypothetical protein DW184_00340 [Enterobacter cloacae]RSB28750.1 hypothetical protein EGK68_19410 [Enterobacter cloacae]RWT29019.1 hypothetical protein DN460_08345 [Enterobacter cloacae]
MDIALLNRGWNRTCSDTIVNLEARKLVETANRLSAFYLNVGLTRIKFVEEIKQVVEKEQGGYDESSRTQSVNLYVFSRTARICKTGLAAE